MKRKAIVPLVFGAVIAVMILASTPVRASESDEKIEQLFKQTYVYRTYLKGDAVRTEAQAGVVILTGTVSEESHKALAQETVANLPGVTHVDNHLEVKGGIPAVNSDAWVRAKVQNMLTFHRSVNNQAEVDVQQGLVILRGIAISKNQSELTRQYAKAVEGVTDVRNEMTVVAPLGGFAGPTDATIDDASITALVRLTLQYHSLACAFDNEVKTRDGVVVLSGKPRNIEEQDMAAELITDIHGVQNVIDTHNGIAAYGYIQESVPAQSSPTERLADNDGKTHASPRLAGGVPDL